MKSANQRPAAATVVPTLMMPSAPSTSSSILVLQGHDQRNNPGNVVLPSPGGVRYRKLYSPSAAIPSISSGLPDHHHLIPLSQRNNTQVRVCPPPMQSLTTQQSSGSTGNTALAPPSSTAAATTNVSRPTSTSVVRPPIVRPQSDLMIDDEIIFVREETGRNPTQTRPPLKRDATSPFSDPPPQPPAAKRPNIGN